MKCRHCKTTLQHVFLDLGYAPPSNAYLNKDRLSAPETYYPLKLNVCHECWLVQTEDYTEADELFNSEYAYFSSVSSSWLSHAAQYVAMITDRLDLNQNSHVIEIASNDGYLLKNFVTAGIPCLGIEPTDSTADAAEKHGIEVLRNFFGSAVAQQLAASNKAADLIIGNNVYAHVPDINDFTQGMRIALKPGGTITLEFPHLLSLIDQIQFDTVYHEHFSYLSLHSVSRVFACAGLRVFDVEQISTHGGSLRIYGCHENDPRPTTQSVNSVLETEAQGGLTNLETYASFQPKANAVKNGLLSFLLKQQADGKLVAAYGAAAKGCTLLNYAGIKPDLLSFVCDAAPSKQGRFLPGTHIPIYSPTMLAERKPDYVIILPWNIADEVIQQNSELLKSWGGRFVTAVPEIVIR